MKLTDVHSGRISNLIRQALREYAIVRIKEFHDGDGDDDPEYELDDGGIDAAAKQIMVGLGKIEDEMVAKKMEASHG